MPELSELGETIAEAYEGVYDVSRFRGADRLRLSRLEANTRVTRDTLAELKTLTADDVEVGEIVVVDGFRFKRAVDGANDADLNYSSFGGLYWHAIPLYGPTSPEISVEQLGVTLDGATDAHAIITAALARGWRSFYVAGHMHLSDELVLSTQDGGVIQYNDVKFRGPGSKLAKISFGHGAVSYPDMTSIETLTADLATTPVGFGVYYTVAATENSGAKRLSITGLKIEAPARGIGIFYASSAGLTLTDVEFSTNGTRAFSHITAKDVNGMTLTECVFGDAYFGQQWHTFFEITNRTTIAANAVYIDNVEWERCYFGGSKYAAIIDVGSMSQATRNMYGCWSTGYSHFGYLGGRGVSLHMVGWWSEQCMQQVRFQGQLGATDIIDVPSDLETFYADGGTLAQWQIDSIAGVIDHNLVQYGMVFNGGWAFGATIENYYVAAHHSLFDFTGLSGVVNVSGGTSARRQNARTDHYHVRNGNETAVTNIINMQAPTVPDGLGSDAVDIPVIDKKGGVNWIGKSQYAFDDGGTTRRMAVNLKTEPRGTASTTAGTGGTFGASFEIKAQVPFPPVFGPVIEVKDIMFSGAWNITLTGGNASAGEPGGTFKWRITTTQKSGAAGKFSVQEVTPISGEYTTGTFFKYDTPPTLLWATIDQDYDGSPRLFIGFDGGEVAGSAVVTIEADGAVSTGVNGKTFNTFPMLSLTDQSTTEALLVAAEAAVVGTTSGATMTEASAPYAIDAWNPGPVASGGSVIKTFALPGAVQGQQIEVVPPYDLQGLMTSAYVSATGTATVVLGNLTGADVTLANSASWRVVNKG